MDTENAGHSLNNTTNTSYTHNLIAYVGVPCVALGTIILITVLVGWHILVNDCNTIVQDPITYYYITAKCICEASIQNAQQVTICFLFYGFSFSTHNYIPCFYNKVWLIVH